MLESGGYWRGVETWCSNFQDGAEEIVLTACWVVVEGGRTQPCHKQVSYVAELALLTRADIGRWELENKHAQAACWLVFMGQHHRAVKVLMNSKGAWRLDHFYEVLKSFLLR